MMAIKCAYTYRSKFTKNWIYPNFRQGGIIKRILDLRKPIVQDDSVYDIEQ